MSDVQVDIPWWATEPFDIMFGTCEKMPPNISAEAIHSVVRKHGYGIIKPDDNAVSVWTDRGGKVLARVRFTGVTLNSGFVGRNIAIVKAAREGKCIVHTYKRRRRGEDETTEELVGVLDRRVSQLDKPEPVLIRGQAAADIRL